MTEKVVLYKELVIPPMSIVTLVSEFTMSSVADDVSIITVVPEILKMLTLPTPSSL